ncbi:protein DpdJ [Solirubrobacter soli]|uniref:protein DpdJ n=1 Tax=Solirubrobacter soli TaxID=363832 RepID=UPI000405B027|nr:protein DpdJ [Solirubrobacter soli]
MTDLALEFLGVLEGIEARLLCWGYVDVGHQRAELLSRADSWALEHDRSGTATGESLIADLERRGLVLAVDTGTHTTYRTRMAEAVRLASRLRQMFPQHAHGSAWLSAPTLVADYRLAIRPRRYPRRDVLVDDVLESLSDAGIDSPWLAGAERLLSDRGEGFRLSRFQAESARAVFEGLRASSAAGTIVGAGTGAGKTLAFYLPALSMLSASRGGTRVLAVYPRIELLRDQLASTFAEARRLDSSKRKIRVGTLYGATPPTGRWLRESWRTTSGGRVCPYMRCPACDEGDLLWKDEDRTNEREVLHCRRCRHVVDDELALTRRSLDSRPVDILFTTTEMLNRALGDGFLRRLVGVGPRAEPVQLMLLDEVHTYEGSAGAHVAHVLRRWRRARGRPVHFVGLSATLRDPAGFFAALTGLHETQITSIEPRSEDVVSEGQEYLLALRADPTSGTSVLSTSIQTSMLFQRVLDPIDRSVSEGAFGQRLFAFTDDLDVVNRLYFDLLDAEGLDSYGRPQERLPLAFLRKPHDDLANRRAAGQSWESLATLGHRLEGDFRVGVGRTTSQDAGVDRNASVIAATASLEVGFDDDRVGGVLQHKSPRGAAAFLQRRGRAGRTREMRPWTIVTLADGGRDRIAYQRYEELFDPTLGARNLPVNSPTIVRMQAVFALIDWLTEKAGTRENTWSVLQRPTPPDARDAVRRHRDGVLQWLHRILDDNRVRDQLRTCIERSLGLDAATVDAILWDPPRPLLTSVIPTAVRRLESDWTTLEPPGTEVVADGPLPEFVVSRLFGDLQLPEVTIISPGQNRGDDEQRTDLPIVLSLTAYAPGRVSHRLTVGNRFARHWVAPPELESGVGFLDLSTFCESYERLEDAIGGGAATRVIRPTGLRVVQPPQNTLSSSHGRLIWRSEIRSSTSGRRGDVSLCDRIPGAGDLCWHLHADRRPVTVRRWAASAEVDLRVGTASRRGRIEFRDGGVPAALGFDATVDALSIDVSPPERFVNLRDEFVRSLRSERFRAALEDSPELDLHLGRFDRERLAAAVQASLTQKAVAHKLDLRTAFEMVGDEILDEVGRILDSAPEDAETGKHTRKRISDALKDAGVRDVVTNAIAVFGERPDDWQPWLAARWTATVAALLHRAIQDLCPEFDAEEVVPEFEARGDGAVRIWLVETTIGGSGLLQAAAERLVDDPSAFVDLTLAGLSPGTQESVAWEMGRVTELLDLDADFADAMTAVRRADDHMSRENAFQLMLELARERGVFVCHPVVAAVSARFLRPGAGEHTDALTARLLREWDETEAELDIELELAAFSRLYADDEGVDQLLGGVYPTDRLRRWRASQVQGLLWPRGAAARRSSLPLSNRFSDVPPVDAALVNSQLPPQTAPVQAGDVSELFDPVGRLASGGAVVLQGGADQARELRQDLLLATASSVETGGLLDHARIRTVRRVGDSIEVGLSLDLAR